MSTPFNIAIDGYSSCGKSTIAKSIANKYNFRYVDSGAMYRAITLFFMRVLVSDLNSFDLGDKYWRPWSNPIFPSYLLKELLPPAPFALSYKQSLYFLFKKFAIVDPDIPDPMIQKSNIIQMV